MTLDTTIGFAETTSFEIKKTEFAPSNPTEGTGTENEVFAMMCRFNAGKEA